MVEKDASLRNQFESPIPGTYTHVRHEGDYLVRHIDSELQGLKDLALQMGGCVEKALEAACRAVVSGDAKGVEQVEKHESRIDDLQILIDESSVSLLAKQAPVAKDLRLVFAIAKINTDLERMGDQCMNISLAARDVYRAWPKAALPDGLDRMISEVGTMVRSVLDAFSRRDVELSQKVLEQDDLVDELKDKMIAALTAQMKSNPEQIEIALAFIMIAKNLERLADHATNIAEEVIYLATGNDVRHGHTVSVNS